MNEVWENWTFTIPQNNQIISRQNQNNEWRLICICALFPTFTYLLLEEQQKLFFADMSANGLGYYNIYKNFLKIERIRPFCYAYKKKL